MVKLIAALTLVRIEVFGNLFLAAGAGQVEQRLGFAFFAVQNAADKSSDHEKG